MTIAGLAGAGIAQGWSLVTARIWTNQLPKSALFHDVFWYLWLPLAIVAGVSGLTGAYRALLPGSARPTLLWVFAILCCLIIRIDGQELGWSIIRFALFAGGEHIQVGVNVFGLVLPWWLMSAGLSRASQSRLRKAGTLLKMLPNPRLQLTGP